MNYRIYYDLPKLKDEYLQEFVHYMQGKTGDELAATINRLITALKDMGENILTHDGQNYLEAIGRPGDSLRCEID